MVLGLSVCVVCNGFMNGVCAQCGVSVVVSMCGIWFLCSVCCVCVVGVGGVSVQCVWGCFVRMFVLWGVYYVRCTYLVCEVCVLWSAVCV